MPASHRRSDGLSKPRLTKQRAGTGFLTRQTDRKQTHHRQTPTNPSIDLHYHPSPKFPYNRGNVLCRNDRRHATNHPSAVESGRSSALLISDDFKSLSVGQAARDFGGCDAADTCRRLDYTFRPQPGWLHFDLRGPLPRMSGILAHGCVSEHG